jgi:hypothetical protein
MLQGYIVDPETGKVVAVIRHGEVFRDDEEGAKIATGTCMISAGTSSVVSMGPTRST